MRADVDYGLSRVEQPQHRRRNCDLRVTEGQQALRDFLVREDAHVAPPKQRRDGFDPETELLQQLGRKDASPPPKKLEPVDSVSWMILAKPELELRSRGRAHRRYCASGILVP